MIIFEQISLSEKNVCPKKLFKIILIKFIHRYRQPFKIHLAKDLRKVSMAYKDHNPALCLLTLGDEPATRETVGREKAANRTRQSGATSALPDLLLYHNPLFHV